MKNIGSDIRESHRISGIANGDECSWIDFNGVLFIPYILVFVTTGGVICKY